MTLRQRVVPASAPGAAESCSLTAEDGQRRGPAMSQLFEHLAGQEQSARGNRFTFRGDPAALWPLVTQFVDEESVCCPFYDYEMRETADGVDLLVSTAPSPVQFEL